MSTSECGAEKAICQEMRTRNLILMLQNNGVANSVVDTEGAVIVGIKVVLGVDGSPITRLITEERKK